MQCFSISFLLALVSLAVSVSAAGWTVDLVSCKDTKLQGQIRESMRWVFDRADDAVRELSKNPLNDDVWNLKCHKGFTNVDRCAKCSILSGLSMTPAMSSRLYRKSDVSVWATFAAFILLTDFAGAYQAIAGMRNEQPKNIFDSTTAVRYSLLEESGAMRTDAKTS